MIDSSRELSVLFCDNRRERHESFRKVVAPALATRFGDRIRFSYSLGRGSGEIRSLYGEPCLGWEEVVNGIWNLVVFDCNLPGLPPGTDVQRLAEEMVMKHHQQGIVEPSFLFISAYPEEYFIKEFEERLGASGLSKPYGFSLLPLSKDWDLESGEWKTILNEAIRLLRLAQERRPRRTPDGN